MTNITRAQWSAVKEGLKSLGIDFRVQDTCCVGCITDTAPEGVPALYTLKKCFKPLTGGWLYHDNIAVDSELTSRLADLLTTNGYSLEWDRSQDKAIHIEGGRAS